MDQETRTLLAIVNPKSGQQGRIEELRRSLASRFGEQGWNVEIHETAAEEDLASFCRTACERGVSLVIAAGGDGTLSAVVSGVAGTGVPLGVVPLGTGNDLARVLTIPLKPDQAMDLLSGDHALARIDSLKVGDCHYLSNVSVGVTPEVVRETRTEHKKTLGRLAYLLPFLRRSDMFRARRYTVVLDGVPMRVRAAEIMISNSTLFEAPPSVFGPPETLSDGRFEVYLVTAKSVWGSLRILSRLFRRRPKQEPVWHLSGTRSIRVEADPPVRVQADGELIGTTPVEVELVPASVPVIVPVGVPEKDLPGKDPAALRIADVPSPSGRLDTVDFRNADPSPPSL